MWILRVCGPDTPTRSSGHTDQERARFDELNFSHMPTADLVALHTVGMPGDHQSFIIRTSTLPLKHVTGTPVLAHRRVHPKLAEAIRRTRNA
jgi:hypothetical protein